jgi:hypothetical protein
MSLHLHNKSSRGGVPRPVQTSSLKAEQGCLIWLEDPVVLNASSRAGASAGAGALPTGESKVTMENMLTPRVPI